MRLLALACLSLCVFIASPAHATGIGAAKRGEQIYKTRCASCHDLNLSRTGPSLHYAFGRQAGSGGDYEYSPALQSSGIVWTETTLDQWLANPALLVPGQKMFFITNDPQDRADVIAFLKQSALHR